MEKKKVPQNTVTRDIKNLAAPTGNIYESVVILYKRANQIASAEKKELMKQPIRRSIRDRLAEAQVEADALNKNRRGHEKRKERSITHL